MDGVEPLATPARNYKSNKGHNQEIYLKKEAFVEMVTAVKA
jgi:hypothetical protein